jgi:hypothetical protein
MYTGDSAQQSSGYTAKGRSCVRESAIMMEGSTYCAGSCNMRSAAMFRFLKRRKCCSKVSAPTCTHDLSNPHVCTDTVCHKRATLSNTLQLWTSFQAHGPSVPPTAANAFRNGLSYRYEIYSSSLKYVLFDTFFNTCKFKETDITTHLSLYNV